MIVSTLYGLSFLGYHLPLLWIGALENARLEADRSSV